MRIPGALLLLAAGSPLAAQVPAVARVLTIGCESCGDATQFGSIWDVSISSRGELLVTDRDAPVLRRFDATGKPVWSGGSKGKGPGEYSLPIRAALTSRGMLIVDMTNARVTDLTESGSVRATTTVTTMPMAAQVNDRGDLWIANDNFRGTLRLFRRLGTDSLREAQTLQGSKANVAIAVAPDGSIAAMLDTKKYEIVRFDAQGTKLPSIVRDIPQVRRTPEEEAEVRERMNRARGMVAAESKARGGRTSPPVFRQEELSLKDHLVIDGLRFDPSGRLWVHTQRGTQSTTVFDVFAPNGGYLGGVTIPMKITSYSLAGSWLATAGENDDGIPVVTVWKVR